MDRTTIWKVEEQQSDWRYKALLDFTFSGVPQDYDKFLQHPYLAGKYGGEETPETETDEAGAAIRVTEAVPYTPADFLREAFLDEAAYQQITRLLFRKKNIILQGVPGVGKTFITKRLAYSILGKKDASRVCAIQFHQSYSYEDFIMGYKPCENGFALKTGLFHDSASWRKTRRRTRRISLSLTKLTVAT